MKLNLQRPLVFLDIESTGLSVTADRIVELSMVKVMPDGTEDVRTQRFNPTIPISAEASAVNGIKDEDVADCPTFKEKAHDVMAFIEGCDLAGFNSNHYDIPLLAEELLRAGIDFRPERHRLIDVQTIFHKMEQRTLKAAYKFYCDKRLEGAHTAEADTKATYEVLMAQLDRYSDLQNDVAFLSDFSSRGKNVDLACRIVLNDAGEEVVNFGKHKGKTIRELVKRDPAFFAWVQQGDFPQDTKRAFLRLRLKYKDQ